MSKQAKSKEWEKEQKKEKKEQEAKEKEEKKRTKKGLPPTTETKKSVLINSSSRMKLLCL
jgi:hypothetical protein